jgi:hypothetical protein
MSSKMAYDKNNSRNVIATKSKCDNWALMLGIVIGITFPSLSDYLSRLKFNHHS